MDLVPQQSHDHDHEKQATRLRVDISLVRFFRTAERRLECFAPRSNRGEADGNHGSEPMTVTRDDAACLSHDDNTQLLQSICQWRTYGARVQSLTEDLSSRFFFFRHFFSCRLRNAGSRSYPIQNHRRTQPVTILSCINHADFLPIQYFFVTHPRRGFSVLLDSASRSTNSPL